MTEKRFKMIITSADGSFHYLDKITGEKITSTLELENKLNELNNENEQLKSEMGELGTAHAEEINSIEDKFDEEILKLEKENEELKTQLQNTSAQRNEFHRVARENANWIGKFEEENKQLKKQYRELQIDFNDTCGIVYDLRESKLDLEDENEQLKSKIEELKELVVDIDPDYYEELYGDVE